MRVEKEFSDHEHNTRKKLSCFSLILEVHDDFSAIDYTLNLLIMRQGLVLAMAMSDTARLQRLWITGPWHSW